MLTAHAQTFNFTLATPTLTLPWVVVIMGVVALMCLALAYRTWIGNTKHPSNIFYALTVMMVVFFTFALFYPQPILADSAYSYDTAGNMIKETKDTGELITYTYNAFNRLESVTDKNGTTKYVYGPGGERIMKILSDGGVHIYSSNKLAEQDEDGNWINYIYLDPINKTNLVAISDKDGMHYVINDHLGSPSIITNNTGAVEQQLDYTAFGIERINEINRQNNPSSFTSPFSFTGQRKDLESDLLYYGARYYNPEIGRFTQPDPMIVAGNQNDPRFQNALMNPQLLNPYSYAGNNPITNVDENGESTKKAWALNPMGTMKQTAFWLGVTRGYLRLTNRPVSAALLEHALTLNPKPLIMTSENNYAFVVDAIRNSNEFKSYVDKYIAKAEAEGEINFDTWRMAKPTKDRPEKLVFENGDLYTSLHGAESTRLAAWKLDDGSWDIEAVITDTYDFKFENYSSVSSIPADVGNNAAVVSQSRQVITPYKVTIGVDDKRPAKRK